MVVNTSPDSDLAGFKLILWPFLTHYIIAIHERELSIEADTSLI